MTRVEFGLPADDLGRATAFYRDVFGWSAQYVKDGEGSVLCLWESVQD